MDIVDEELLEFWKALNANQVKYLMVVGFAVNMHGFSRATQVVGVCKKYETQNREYNGSVSTRPLYVIRASRPEPIFIELGHILNVKDRDRILKPSNRQLLANWITEGFLK